MRAVDVGVGHDDDLVVAQVVDVELGAHLHAQGLTEVVDFLVAAHLGAGRPQHVQDLAAQGQQGLVLAVAGHLGRSARAVAFDDEKLGPVAGGGGAVHELAGQAQFLGGGLAGGFLFGAAAQAFLGPQHEEVEDGARGFGVTRKPCVEVVAHGAFDKAGGFFGGEAVLGLAHELRLADEDRDEGTGAGGHVLARHKLGLAVLHAFAVGAEPLQDGGPEARLMRAAFGGGDGVAVAVQKPVAGGGPVDRPFDGTGEVVFLGERDAAREGAVGVGGGLFQLVREIVGKAPGEVEDGLHRRVAVGDRGFPADLDAREEIGLGPRHPHQAVGLEGERAEDLRIGVEGDGGAAAVGGGAHLLQRALRDAAGEFLREKFAVAGDLDPHAVRKRVDDRGAHAVQAARGGIGVAVELAARVERAEDHLERRLAGEFRVGVDGDAAAVVADGDRVVGVKFHLDAGGVAGHGLVHRVVQHFGHKVMQGAFVGAADIHAGALAHGFEPLEHLDRGGVVGIGAGEEVAGHRVGLSLGYGAGLDHPARRDARLGGLRRRRDACAATARVRFRQGGAGRRGG